MTPVRALSWLASFSLLLASSLAPNQHVAIAAPAPITMSLSYADDLRASATNFPTPWAGAPDTVFIGSGAPWDAGAIRLVNTSSAPVLVNDVTVYLHHGSGGASGPGFDLWC